MIRTKRKKNKMIKKIIKITLISSIFIFNFTYSNSEETNCNTAFSKLKPGCNFIGKGVEKMKGFSKKNKTLDQSFGNIKEKIKK